MRQNSLRMPLGVAGFRANVKKDGREPEVRRQRSEVRNQRWMFFSNAGRRIPTSGDASRATRARPPGPSRPDDEQCRGS